MTTVNPYLTFNGNCEEAFNFYKSVFGGEFPYVARFNEMPENPECVIPEADKEKIMHISLPISKETVLMGSDTSGAFENVTVFGDNFAVSINAETMEETEKIFNGLSEGGVVKMPLDKTFWGSYFGMFTDKFDINWMINCRLEEK